MPEKSAPMAEELQKTQIGEPLQFDRAEYVEASASGPICGACDQRITDHYYQLAGKLTCEACKERALQQLFGQSGAGRFVKALFFGTGAAILGTIIYLAILKATNYHLALVTIVVGIMVGVAVRKGSNSRGGWLYQGLAVFLTYCSIAATTSAIALQQFAAQPARRAKTDAPPSSNKKKLDQSADEVKPDNAPHAAKAQGADGDDLPDFKALSRGESLWQLIKATGLVVGFLFLTPVFIVVFNKDLIMFIIYAVGLWEAWKINRAPTLKISGPFQVGRASAVR
jgi:hypothetical protein